MADQHPPTRSGWPGITAGSKRRVLTDARPIVAQRIQNQYADALAKANWLGRLFLRLRIRREIRRELERIAPPGASYSQR